jgi:hypothetical protein
MAKSLAAVSEILSSATSARRIVFTPRADCRARSCALHLRSARPALICALESTREAYLDHENAKSELKGLIPEDAEEAIGHGIRHLEAD